MSFRIGLIIVIIGVIVGYIGGGGNIKVLLQPFEWVVILSITIGSFIMSNPKNTQKSVLKSLSKLNKDSPCNKSEYVKLLIFLFNFFKYSISTSLAEVEQHIENPEKSKFFQDFAVITKNKEALTFFCDYFRIITLGFDDTHELDNMMEYRINERREYYKNISYSVQRLADALPGIGIIAAVLGVIIAMGAVDAEPSVLGYKVASAMVGTLLGVLLCYGALMPIGYYLDKFFESEVKILECIKIAIMSYINGYPPSISVEFARQVIQVEFQPSFYELESAIQTYNSNAVK